MNKRSGPVHVATTRRTYGGKVYETHLLRRSYREGGKVKNETVGNVSHLPPEIIAMIRRALKKESLVNPESAFEITESFPCGDSQAVLLAMERLNLRELLGSRRSRKADIVLGLIAARVLSPQTKLATCRGWSGRTYSLDLGIADADEDECYEAMDWLLTRQGAIEKRLAARHLSCGSLALYDLSSSYFEGTHCPLAKLGYNRDGKRHKLQVNYGLLTDRRGCPVAVSVYPGNVGDAKTLLPQVVKLKEAFGLEAVTLVGDRGMIGQAHIDTLRETAGVSWITALKSGQIRALMNAGAIQMDLFDERNLFCLTSPEYPGERLIACRNPELGRLRTHKRLSLLEATELELVKVQKSVADGRLRGADQIGVRVGKVLNKFKVAKHFILEIEERGVSWARNEAAIAEEAALDGIYVIRSSVEAMEAAETVRHYKGLAEVERAFRSLKTVDLKIRPIHHRLEHRVKAHILLCMLAYYVEWHLREAWRPLCFGDEDQAAKRSRDPVAPTKRSPAAEAKVRSRTLPDNTPVHSFRTLLEALSRQVRNVCRATNDSASFTLTTQPDATQRRALELVQTISLTAQHEA